MNTEKKIGVRPIGFRGTFCEFNLDVSVAREDDPPARLLQKLLQAKSNIEGTLFFDESQTLVFSPIVDTSVTRIKHDDSWTRRHCTALIRAQHWREAPVKIDPAHIELAVTQDRWVSKKDALPIYRGFAAAFLQLNPVGLVGKDDFIGK